MRAALVRTRARRGQSMVEFALVLPVILWLTMGIVDLGRGIFFYNMLSNAAREGARVGIVRTNTLSQMCTQAIERVQAPGVSSSAGCATIADATATSFGTLTVTVHLGKPGDPMHPDRASLSYSFTPITPLIGTASIPITAESDMYVEQ
jgi:Flp pilus assembly protein TadG